MRDLMTMLNAFDANKCEHGIELVETVQKNSQLSQNSRESIKLFGVEHMSCQPYAARYILKYKPSVVVVETGITPDHCSKTGFYFQNKYLIYIYLYFCIYMCVCK